MLGSELPSVTWVSGDEDSPSCLLGIAPSVLTSPPSSVTITLLSNCFFSISIYVNSLKSNFFPIAPIMMSIHVQCLLYGKANKHVSSLYRILKTLSPLSISFLCFSPLPVSSLLSGHTSILSSVDGNIYLCHLSTQKFSRELIVALLSLCTRGLLLPRILLLLPSPLARQVPPHNSLRSL